MDSRQKKLLKKKKAELAGELVRKAIELKRKSRELEIEAGLEQVRTRAMAMHSSSDLADTANTVFTELGKLGIQPIRSGVGIVSKEGHAAQIYSATASEDGSRLNLMGEIKLAGYQPFEDQYAFWERQENYYVALRGKQLEDYYETLSAQLGAELNVDGDGEEYGYWFMFPEGFLYAWTEKKYTKAELNILERFKKVIELTFRRYMDLQKAEAQAREAQIEAALERVRAKAMAMHSSEDVTFATITMFTELDKLGIKNFRCGINHIKTDRTQEVWSVTNSADGKTIRSAGSFNIDDHPFWKRMYEAWMDKKEFFYDYLTGKEKEAYVEILNATPNYLSQPIGNFPDVHFQIYYFGEGAVWAMTLQHPHSGDEKQIMKRFASVFSLTFRRYQDLQKAEAQAREATVEAALEKVRGRAMAMHNSNDLSVSASTVFTELRKLGINPIRCGVGLLNKESRKAQLYSAAPGEQGDTLSLVGWVLLEKNPVLEKIYGSWLDQYDYFPELQGEELKSYYELLLAGLPVRVPDISGNEKEFGHFFPFSVGCLYAWSDIRYNEAETKIIKRFAAIIDLTFRRYMELQKSEANAREAVKQAALDRVRADIASMRTVADLDRITPLIWNELTILGIPFVRCGVFIMDGLNELIHTFLSTPDGKAIAAFHIPYETQGNIRQVLGHWKNGKNYIDHWDKAAFKEFAATLVKQGALDSPEQYLRTLPPGGIYLHFLPFLQGMLYVGNTTRLSEEATNLIQSVADAFSTAYARYEDFNKLEAAKQQVEEALVDLKQAQQQLVQSEKMASLGELTAGIAHEIQNPLNFVNNFSDVSNELLEEMKEEMAKGDIEKAIAIAGDVQENLERIAHHGKRADGIVKGMLQHSRASSGKKEMTDINILCDEYLRLAYHGMRAKDKSFSAKFETHFDNDIGKVNVMPQEMGRVILNLISNAFYAVGEKARQNIPGYQAAVTVSTKKEDGNLVIAVADNGSGVPQRVMDKIFQPFFTTKPAGQGTGLGLSLSYDIVKAHGGEIKVETGQGAGSNFVIVLPSGS